MVCLLGRRYEMFDSLQGWRTAVEGFHKQIAAAVPIVERHRMPLGIENHKDWRVDEQVALLEQYGSEYLGVSLDTGNNLTVMDDPMEVVEKLAPYTFNVHLKDMAAIECPSGFLLSEVPLGEGMLDMKRIVATIKRARPDVNFSLEMITRDPLEVPCLDRQVLGDVRRCQRGLPGAPPRSSPRAPSGIAAAPHQRPFTRRALRARAGVRRSIDCLCQRSVGAGLESVLFVRSVRLLRRISCGGDLRVELQLRLRQSRHVAIDRSDLIRSTLDDVANPLLTFNHRHLQAYRGRSVESLPRHSASGRRGPSRLP